MRSVPRADRSSRAPGRAAHRRSGRSPGCHRTCSAAPVPVTIPKACPVTVRVLCHRLSRRDVVVLRSSDPPRIVKAQSATHRISAGSDKSDNDGNLLHRTMFRGASLTEEFPRGFVVLLSAERPISAPWTTDAVPQRVPRYTQQPIPATGCARSTLRCARSTLGGARSTLGCARSSWTHGRRSAERLAPHSVPRTHDVHDGYAPLPARHGHHKPL